MTVTALDLDVAGKAKSKAVEIPSPDVLYKRYVLDVSRWLAHRTGHGNHVEDLTHDVFIVAFRRVGEFRGEAQLRTWLYQITLNISRNYLRKRARLRWFGRSLPDELACAQPGVEQLCKDRRDVAAVSKALGRLSEKHRSVLIAHVLDGLSATEIAELHGARVETVWVWLHRARKRLAHALDSELESSP